MENKVTLSQLKNMIKHLPILVVQAPDCIYGYFDTGIKIKIILYTFNDIRVFYYYNGFEYVLFNFITVSSFVKVIEGLIYFYKFTNYKYLACKNMMRDYRSNLPVTIVNKDKLIEVLDNEFIGLIELNTSPLIFTLYSVIRPKVGYIYEELEILKRDDLHAFMNTPIDIYDNDTQSYMFDIVDFEMIGSNLVLYYSEKSKNLLKMTPNDLFEYLNSQDYLKNYDNRILLINKNTGVEPNWFYRFDSLKFHLDNKVPRKYATEVLGIDL